MTPRRLAALVVCLAALVAAGALVNERALRRAYWRWRLEGASTAEAPDVLAGMINSLGAGDVAVRAAVRIDAHELAALPDVDAILAINLGKRRLFLVRPYVFTGSEPYAPPGQRERTPYRATVQLGVDTFRTIFAIEPGRSVTVPDLTTCGAPERMLFPVLRAENYPELALKD